MKLYKKLLKRIEDGSTIHCNEKFAKDLEAIANKHFKQLPIHGVVKSLPDEIYATYDRRDGEILAGFTSKKRCEIEAKEGGCGMQTFKLYEGEQI